MAFCPPHVFTYVETRPAYQVEGEHRWWVAHRALCRRSDHKSGDSRRLEKKKDARWERFHRAMWKHARGMHDRATFGG